jgi:hypothetical protein
MKNFFLLLAGIIFIFIGSLNNAQAELLWELKTGDVRTYIGHDSTSKNSWNQTITVLETETLGGHEYFKIDQYNYHGEGDHDEAFFRSTENQILVYDGNGGEEILFQIAPFEDTWFFFDERHERIENEVITIPYNGGTTLDAYVFRCSEDGSPYWYEYVFPGLGHIQEVDWYVDNNAPYIEQLSAIVPIPGAVWLLGSGLAGLIGLQTKKK